MSAKHHEIYFTLVREFLEAVPSSGPAVSELNNRILSGDLYKALKAAKKLITYESKSCSIHVLRGQRVREDSPSRLRLNPRELEAHVLMKSAARLQAIQATIGTRSKDELDAALVIKNRKLWTILVAAVSDDEQPRAAGA
jgi:hypothetical protein